MKDTSNIVKTLDGSDGAANSSTIKDSFDDCSDSAANSSTTMKDTSNIPSKTLDKTLDVSGGAANSSTIKDSFDDCSDSAANSSTNKDSSDGRNIVHDIVHDDSNSSFASTTGSVTNKNPSSVNNAVEMRRFPCNAKVVPLNHNEETGYFEVPENVQHGYSLLCSHPSCRKAGARFRFCKYCDKPMSKAGFNTRHGHCHNDPTIGRPCTTNKEKKATTTTTTTTAKNNNCNNRKKRQTTGTLSQHRSQRQKVSALGVAKVVDYRKHKGKSEFKIRWKGKDPSDDSWVPDSDLTACDDAKAFMKEREAKKKEREELERWLGLPPPSSSSKVRGLEFTQDKKLLQSFRSRNEYLFMDPSTAKKDLQLQHSNKALQERIQEEKTKERMEFFGFSFKEVDRIHVNETDAKDRVTHARIYGIPVVLTGHKGWPQFATEWMKDTGAAPSAPSPVATPTSAAASTTLLDLSQPHDIDIQKMIDDIGDEVVPIVRKNYNEYDPIKKRIPAKEFLEHSWPNGDLYLHQWQFPSSDTAAKKFCGPGQCVPIPNDVIEEDLVQFWTDAKINHYQYIFMGGPDTVSKVHKDPGGLMITIAPIVGEKECKMVHRDDGRLFMYNGDSKLDDFDLDQFPMTAFTRAWKTVIKPGEILIMPQSTYHACRNVTPCLSYHRFHLDTINLQGFLHSMLADEMHDDLVHDDLIWNVTDVMTSRVDTYVELVRKNDISSNVVPDTIIKAIHILKRLRPVCQQIYIQLERYQRNLKLQNSCKNSTFVDHAKAGHGKSWSDLVQDIDGSFHDFKHRNDITPPRFKRLRIRLTKSRLQAESDADDDDSVDPPKAT